MRLMVSVVELVKIWIIRIQHVVKTIMGVYLGMYWGYLEEVFLIYKDLVCNSCLLSLWELCYALTFGIHNEYLSLLCYFEYLMHSICYQRRWSLDLHIQTSHYRNFSITIFWNIKFAWKLQGGRGMSKIFWSNFQNPFPYNFRVTGWGS